MLTADQIQPEPGQTGEFADNLTARDESEIALEIERLIALRLHAGRGRRHAAALVLRLLRSLE